MMIDVGGSMYFACDECPIVSKLDIRLALAEEHPEHGDFQFDYCGCDKVGDEFFQCGYCRDAWADIPERHTTGKRRTGRARRREMRAKKFQRHKAIVMNSNRWCSEVLSLGFDKTGLEYSRGLKFWTLDIEDKLNYTYVKRPKSSKYKKFYKNYSNRVIRRKKIALKKGNQHHKYFDYWWTID